jgi:hypothetical protein
MNSRTWCLSRSCIRNNKPLASFSVGAMLGGVKHSKDRTTDRAIGWVYDFQNIRHKGALS